ncbi:MAG: peptidase M14, partial [Saprospiraceae bacterium]
YGLSYFTRDRVDFYYPRYGSSYPNMMGGIGMLTEQGGIGAGRAVETNDGYVLSLRQRIFDHYTTSLATARAAARNRAALLGYSMDAWTPAKTQTVSGRAAYLVAAEAGGYGTDFVRMLLLNGVRVEETTEAVSVAPDLDYRTGRAGARREFPAGSYLVRTDQPRHLFVTNLLERNVAIDDSVMYDMAPWSAPLAYNLDAYALARVPPVRTRPVTEVDMPGKLAEIMDVPTYAYLIDWRQRNAPRALAELWRRGYRVRAARAPFTSGGREYSAGSLIVLRGRNLERGDSLRADMRAVADLAGVTVIAAPTGRLTTGDDLASTRNVPVKQPRVAMLVEPPFDTYTSGQVYFLFDQETRLPVERIRTSVFRQTSLPKFGLRYGYADLKDYDVLILPDGGGALKELFGKAQRDELMAWVRGGGTIVALEEAAHLFTTDSGLTKIKLTGPQNVADSLTAELAYADREQFFGQRRIPGSALRAPVDVTHPLAFGVKPEVFTLKFGARGLQPGGDLQSVGTYHPAADELLTAGYASRENLDSLAGKTWAGVYPLGEGRVVLLLDNPHYRMFWRGPSRMMQNAVMLVPGF